MKFEKNVPQEAQRYFDAKMAYTTGPVELSRALKQPGLTVVDVRDASDFQKAHVPGSVNLPKDRWQSLEGLSREDLNVVICYSQVCHLAAAAAQQFTRAGYSVMELEGGFKGWLEHHLPVESSSSKPATLAKSRPGVERSHH